MSVGTAKLKYQEQRGIKHHFIDELTIYEEYSAGDYALEFHKRLEKYFMRHDVAIIIGCTGLYIHADLHGMENFPDIPEEIRYYLREKYLLFGLETLQEELREKDPDYFHRVDAHTHNAQRILRALEVIETSGIPYSAYLKKMFCCLKTDSDLSSYYSKCPGKPCMKR
jgi:tRNA dimethylallyltransferase